MAPNEQSGPVRVRAIAPGIYDISGFHKYRLEGEEFEIANMKAFSKKWMELVPVEAPVVAIPPKGKFEK